MLTYFCFILQPVIVKLMVNNQVFYSQEGFIIVGIQYLFGIRNICHFVIVATIFLLCVLKLFIDILFTIFRKDFYNLQIPNNSFLDKLEINKTRKMFNDPVRT